METRFYTLADRRYFLGVVALINSLRMVGHDEPVLVLDCGLGERQRQLLAPHAELLDAGERTTPMLLTTIAPLRRPADVMVLIDADMIVTRSLSELIGRASVGGVVAFEHGSDRFFPEWREALDLPPLRRQPYVSGGLVVMGRSPGAEVLELEHELLGRVDFEQTFWRRNVPGYPFLYGDQDVLNAILASRVDADRIAIVERRLEAIPPFAGLRRIDGSGLRCGYEDGVEPFLLHHYGPKPWIEPTTPGLYTRLLKRLLTGADTAISVPRAELPLHLRPGLRARLRRGPASARHYLRTYLGEPVSAGIRGLRDRDGAR